MLNRIQPEQLTEPDQAADCLDKCDSCTAHVRANTADESESKNNG